MTTLISPWWTAHASSSCPRPAARYNLAVDHRDYYQNFVLDFLEAEHLDAGDALVRVLKSGKRKVYRKDLKQEHPLSRDFLYDFSLQHPEVLQRYRESLPKETIQVSNEALENLQQDPRTIDLRDLSAQLRAIPDWSSYCV